MNEFSADIWIGGECRFLSGNGVTFPSRLVNRAKSGAAIDGIGAFRQTLPR
jgi:hypothetical protein